MSDILVPESHDALVMQVNGTVQYAFNMIRPVWRSRSLIQRVAKLLPVDPSSACQRLFNAAIYDLKEKVIVAGIDIAHDAAERGKLPKIDKSEDVEDYPTFKLLDLCYEMGLLTRSEWRKMKRVYEIRRDLEHEDAEYEAGPEDLIYIFKSCIEIVLSKDPIQVLRVTDVKEFINKPDKSSPTTEFFDDYKSAPYTRQEEIYKYLVSTSLNEEQPDIVRQKALKMLVDLNEITKDPVKIEISRDIQARLDRKHMDLSHARVAYASGALPYLKQSHLKDFFEKFLKKLKEIGVGWRQDIKQSQLLYAFEDVGGFKFCTKSLKSDFLKWMVMTYLGEPGGYGEYGRNRQVFFSDQAAPIIERLIRDSKNEIASVLKDLENDKDIQRTIKKSMYIARRFDHIIDLVEEPVALTVESGDI